MDYQVLFNVVLGGFSALAGWMMNNIYQSLRELASADRDLVVKMNAIEVLVAGTYVKRAEFENKVDAMFTKLDSIEEKLDRKLAHVTRQ